MASQRKKRCQCSMFCRNQPVVTLDFKWPTFGYKTTRICLQKAKQLVDLAIHEQQKDITEKKEIKTNATRPMA